MRLLRGIAIAANVVLVALLASMGTQVLVRVAAQIESGYTPSYLPLVIGLGVIPLGLAMALAGGVVLWLRSGRHWLVLLADVVTSLSVWTILVPLVFLPGGELVIAWGLSPTCAVMTALIAWRHPRRRAIY
jgi:hypothetical protein